RRNAAACQQGDNLGNAEAGSGRGIGDEEGRRGHDDLRGHRECQKPPEFHGLTPTRQSRTLVSALSTRPAPRELQIPRGGVEGQFAVVPGWRTLQPAGESVWRSVVTQITRAVCWVGLSNMCGT